MEKINIGLAIEQRINQLRLSKSEFGRKIGVPQQNVNRILERPSIDTDKLVQISKALDFNFFELYCIPDAETYNASTHGIAAKSVGWIDNREMIQQKEVVSETAPTVISESHTEIVLPPDCPDTVKHIIEKLTMEVTYLRNTVSHLKDMNDEKERFINHLLTNKQ